jgi:hypothetical protein
LKLGPAVNFVVSLLALAIGPIGAALSRAAFGAAPACFLREPQRGGGIFLNIRCAGRVHETDRACEAPRQQRDYQPHGAPPDEMLLHDLPHQAAPAFFCSVFAVS